ncbi:MAG: hypothetical protein U0P45_03400 [Acidimicrobiales bacterium]
MLGAEHELRKLLRGARLVSEVDLLGEPFEVATQVLVSAIQLGQSHLLGNRYPASTVIYLVGQGVRNYDGGYWGRFSLHGVDEDDLRRAWERALNLLGLDDFLWAVDNPTRRYVTPILFHGGIPAYCAPDVFDVLEDELRRGAGDAVDVVAGWRAHPTRFERLDKPAQRFLLGGGEAAIDLLDRLIEMVLADVEGQKLDPYELGLPAYLVEAFLLLPDEHRRRGIRRQRVPRPEVVLDPWSGLGPSLSLPVLPAEAAAQRWTVLGGETIRTFPGSQRSALEVELGPPGPWQVDLGDVDVGGRSFQFQGLLTVPALLFDPASGKLLRDQHLLSLDHVLVVCHRTLAVSADEGGERLGDPDQFPPLSGDWSAYRVLSVPTAGRSRLVVSSTSAESGRSQIARIVVRSSGARPRVAGDIVAGVATHDGREVYDAVPALSMVDATDRSVVEVTVGGKRRSAPVRSLPQGARGYSLGTFLPADQVAAVELLVRGHLGGDLRDAGFAVAPGLQVTRPERPLGPTEAASLAVQTAPGISVDAGGSASDRIEVPAGADGVDLRLTDLYGGVLDVRVSLPRVRWTVTNKGRAAGMLGNTPLSFTPEDIVAGTRLAVRVGAPVALSLVLEASGEVLHQLGPFETGADGRWSFEIGELADSVRHADRPRLDLALRVDGERHAIGAITTRYEVTDLAIESIVAADEGVTLLEVRFSENRHFGGRELRLWPETRPWAEPSIFSIPNDATECIELLAGEDVVPGWYLAELTLADDWAEPERPLSDEGVPRVRIGQWEDEQRYARSLDPGVGLHALELLLRGSPLTRPLDDEVVATVTHELLLVLGDLLHQPGKAMLSDRTYLAVREMLFTDPDGLAKEIPSFLGGRDLDADWIDKVSIALLTDAFDCPFVEASDRDRAVVFRTAPMLGAAADSWRSAPEAADRWEHQTGWRPGGDLPFVGQHVDDAFIRMNPERIATLRMGLEIEDYRPLSPGGYQAAVLQWLERSFPDGHRPAINWQNAYGSLNDKRLRQDRTAAHLLDQILPLKGYQVCRFPADVLAAAFQLLRIRGSRDQATVALWRAIPIAPLLVQRSVLLAIAYYRSTI